MKYLRTDICILWIVTFTKLRGQRSQDSYWIHDIHVEDFNYTQRSCWNFDQEYSQAGERPLHRRDVGGLKESDLSVAVGFKTTCNLVGARRRIMFEEIHFKTHLATLGGLS